MDGEWIDAAGACERLGIRPQTLYAYVSRGRLAARADPIDPRRSLYRVGDLEALSARRSRSRKVSEVAAGAIAWGEPVLESQITAVIRGRLYYRGRDAIRLAETETLESVARLLRGGDGVALKRDDRPRPPTGDALRGRLFAALAARAAGDPPALGRSPHVLAVEAATLLDVVADAVCGQVASGAIHIRLAMAWGQGPGGAGADLIRRALVLIADHELNASAFAARVAAATGASLAASALSGLGALSGPRHGTAADAVGLFWDEAERLGPPAAVANRLAEGRTIPGFGHTLYPHRDPRADALLDRLPPAQRGQALEAAVARLAGLAPNVDFALAAIGRALRLPTDAIFGLFAVARTAGWIAHAIEQGQGDTLIRPRARYVGPTPEV
ncbi:citrate synthase [Phenylobacterium immobile]|uniref:citrate synthase n=1 Tax=Phenylobacterium immobile TaxID=21 RepID=UPI000B849284|nr:citrate synthase [Phenylobacterium immobile]